MWDSRAADPSEEHWSTDARVPRCDPGALGDYSDYSDYGDYGDYAPGPELGSHAE